MKRLLKRFLIIFGLFIVIGGSFLFWQVTRHRIYYFNPDWSPDGSKLVFESTREGKFALYTIQIDGADLRKLTSGVANDEQARWSPDGKQIVFFSDRDGREQLYLMNSDGSQQRRLTNAEAQDFNPSYSPQGDQIAFMSSPPGIGQFHDIFVVRADGTGRTRLTDQNADYMGPRWSPKGDQILFVRGAKSRFPAHNSDEIFVMKSDGSQAVNLTHNNVRDYHACWSKDGQTIYFLSEREGATHVYAMNADGSDAHKVADGSIIRDPGISPDGKFFAYTKEVNGKAGLYIYDIKNAQERLLIGE